MGYARAACRGRLSRRGNADTPQPKASGSACFPLRGEGRFVRTSLTRGCGGVPRAPAHMERAHEPTLPGLDLLFTLPGTRRCRSSTHPGLVTRGADGTVAQERSSPRSSTRRPAKISYNRQDDTHEPTGPQSVSRTHGTSARLSPSDRLRLSLLAILVLRTVAVRLARLSHLPASLARSACSS